VNMNKIVTTKEFKECIRPEIKKNNQKIVLCHGVFDLIHPGHIVHLEQAKEMGDILVVSITSAEYVRKGPGRPYFNNEMRLKVLSALESVDYVILSEEYTAADIIETVKPDIYVKGEEYAKINGDITGKITEEEALVRKHGGVVQFTSGQTFSSTKLINTALSGLGNDVRNYMENFKQKYSMEEIREYTERIKNLNVLVLGDVIIDKYTYCSMQGLMSKDMGYSVKELYSEEYFGGAVAVARHLSSFTEKVTLMSIIGNEEYIWDKCNKELSEFIKLDMEKSTSVPTIIKHRYLTKNENREEYRKIFAVNNILEFPRFEQDVWNVFKSKLEKKIEDYDVVFLCDFGHGLIDEEIKDIVQEKAKFLVLNCQTNSSNKGLNIITKYTRADAFTLDQQELKLAFPECAANEEEGLKKVSMHLNSAGWLTRGSKGAYGIVNCEIHDCPAFTLDVKDTIGAGDAFYAVAGISAAAGMPRELGTLMGNVAGALGANIVGNKDAIEKVNVLKYVNTLMNV